MLYNRRGKGERVLQRLCPGGGSGHPDPDPEQSGARGPAPGVSQPAGSSLPRRGRGRASPRPVHGRRTSCRLIRWVLGACGMGREGSGCTDFVPLEFPDAGAAEAQPGSTRRDADGNGYERTCRQGRAGLPAAGRADTANTQPSRRAPRPPAPRPTAMCLRGEGRLRARTLRCRTALSPGSGSLGRQKAPWSGLQLLQRSAVPHDLQPLGSHRVPGPDLDPPHP